MEELECGSCVKFTKRTTEASYVHILPDKLVYSRYNAVSRPLEDLCICFWISLMIISCFKITQRQSTAMHYIHTMGMLMILQGLLQHCWSIRRTPGSPLYFPFSLAFQVVSLGPGCLHHGVVLHELLHALGFWHEQSRYFLVPCFDPSSMYSGRIGMSM